MSDYSIDDYCEIIDMLDDEYGIELDNRSMARRLARLMMRARRGLPVSTPEGTVSAVDE
jgi:hypothetical protein